MLSCRPAGGGDRVQALALARLARACEIQCSSPSFLLDRVACGWHSTAACSRNAQSAPARPGTTAIYGCPVRARAPVWLARRTPPASRPAAGLWAVALVAAQASHLEHRRTAGAAPRPPAGRPPGRARAQLALCTLGWLAGRSGSCRGAGSSALAAFLQDKVQAGPVSEQSPVVGL